VAAVPPREERGAFDPSCAPWPSEGVGTKGVPQKFDAACGASNKGLGAVRKQENQRSLAALAQGRLEVELAVMSKKTFDQISAGLADAIAIARGEAEPGSYRVHVPADVDVMRIRRNMGLTRDAFAMRFGLQLGTVRDGNSVSAGPRVRFACFSRSSRKSRKPSSAPWPHIRRARKPSAGRRRG